ncbi:hypothetical protein CVT26_011764 [Gymnopilus dilepis]|uniref:Uncharacterized protein n=1 Tax=Gymnopilus dilepis TaxID=231916 RepID=A0A409WX04_9AGAR|nr:hypothetical protein CVT26_011764 [Gymnopilus dilepis]
MYTRYRVHVVACIATFRGSTFDTIWTTFRCGSRPSCAYVVTDRVASNLKATLSWPSVQIAVTIFASNIPARADVTDVFLN